MRYRGAARFVRTERAGGLALLIGEKLVERRVVGEAFVALWKTLHVPRRVSHNRRAAVDQLARPRGGVAVGGGRTAAGGPGAVTPETQSASETLSLFSLISARSLDLHLQFAASERDRFTQCRALVRIPAHGKRGSYSMVAYCASGPTAA